MIDDIVPYQRKILTDLAGLETRVAELYDYYEMLYPARPSYWGKMANEERAHATMLLSLNKELDEGHVFWNIGKFNEAAIAEQVAVLDKALQRANDYNVSEHEALDVAIRIEKSLLEAQFYSTVQSDSKVFPHIAKALVKATEEHIQKLLKKIVDNGGSKEWL